VPPSDGRYLVRDKKESDVNAQQAQAITLNGETALTVLLPLARRVDGPSAHRVAADWTAAPVHHGPVAPRAPIFVGAARYCTSTTGTR
jgi:hypothetical protein